MASDWDAARRRRGVVLRPDDPAGDDEPLDSLVMEARDRLANLGLFAPRRRVRLALLVAQTRDPSSTRRPATSARC